MSISDKSGCTSITWLGLWINVCLGLLKCTIGWFCGSQALLADGAHSLADLSTDVGALLALFLARKPSDHNHHYGHHRFSTLAQLAIALVLVFFAAWICWTSLRTLHTGESLLPGKLAAFVAALSFGVKEWLFWKTRAHARREQSRLIMANAWHHRADSLSSLLVLVAIVATLWMGPQWAFLDKATGAILGAYLMFEGLRLARQATADLTDTAPAMRVVDDLREHILPTPGATAYHDFRARRVGDMIEVSLHLQVAPTLSVCEGHAIAHRVKDNILQRHPEVLDVHIHLEPALPGHLRERGISDSEIPLHAPRFRLRKPLPQPPEPSPPSSR